MVKEPGNEHDQSISNAVMQAKYATEYCLVSTQDCYTSYKYLQKTPLIRTPFGPTPIVLIKGVSSFQGLHIESINRYILSDDMLK